MEYKINNFPKYLKSHKGTVFIFEGRGARDGEATYLKVCGNWRAYVKLKNGEFTCLYIHGRIIELTPATVTEFLKDNPKCYILSDYLDDKVESPQHREYLRKIMLDAIEEEKQIIKQN